MDNLQFNYKYFNIVSLFFVALLMISNTVAVKLISFGPFMFTGAILIFPLTYIFGDVLTEVYGYKRSRRIIWSGFMAILFMSFIYWLVGVLPSAPSWQNQSAYNSILGLVPRIVIASIIGYWAGEFSNSYILAKLKIITKGRYLWIRTITSTIIGEGVDTALFVLIGFFGVIPNSSLLIVIFSGYFFKVIYEIIATPATYRIVKFLKKAEGHDHFDYNTNFNPFNFR